jgi:hypothetical protein
VCPVAAVLSLSVLYTCTCEHNKWGLEALTLKEDYLILYNLLKIRGFVVIVIEMYVSV